MGSYSVRLDCLVLLRSGDLISIGDPNRRRPFLASGHRSDSSVHLQSSRRTSVDYQVRIGRIPLNVIEINIFPLSL